jgi:hypothetical protein
MTDVDLIGPLGIGLTFRHIAHGMTIQKHLWLVLGKESLDPFRVFQI